MHDRLPEWLTWLPGPGFGATGVRLFFVISGFIITHNLLKEKTKSGSINIGSFWIRRFFRIYPAFFAFMITMLLVYLNFDMNLDITKYIVTLFLLTSVIPANSGWYFGHTWSLSVEQIFYLIWPMLIKIGLGSRFLIASILLWPLIRGIHYLLCEKYQIFYIPIYDIVNNYIFMSAGCLLGFLIDKYNFNNKLDNYKMYLLFIFCFFYPLVERLVFDNFLTSFKLAQTYISSFSPVPISICFFYVILFLVTKKNTVFYRIFNSSILVYIGSVSYSIYLCQQFFTIPLNGNTFYIQLFPINVILMVVFSLLLYYLVEVPFVRLGHKLFAKPKSARQIG